MSRFWGADNTRDNSILKRRTASVLDFQGNIEDFHDLFLHLQSAYHEVDAVFAASGLETMDIPTSDVCVREGVDSKHIEVFANKLLPFNLHDTGEAAWNHFKGIEKHFDNGWLYEKQLRLVVSMRLMSPKERVFVYFSLSRQNLDQPYTIVEDFTKEMYSNNLRADIKANQIVQRIKLPDRDMILFVSSVTLLRLSTNPSTDSCTTHENTLSLNLSQYPLLSTNSRSFNSMSGYSLIMILVLSTTRVMSDR
ncbi:hypothetical protein PsorP6_016219 [Peronosclerospora sorghi]|uniref:Uncharacterized protein n=1 Tax=Peronosclerospora sorghi TaxID=230839 RepID=A0ACC0VQX4_9STRA|nr:hypothetical protein PsorP6_016219 [Peronosclerospora sorghi]